MGQAIGGSLPLAIGIAISPIPIIAVVLMLATPRARANGPAFLAGWLFGLGIVGAIVLALAGPRSEPVRCACHLGRLGQDRPRCPAAGGRAAAIPRPPPWRRPGADAQVDGRHRQFQAADSTRVRRRPGRSQPEEPAAGGRRGSGDRSDRQLRSPAGRRLPDLRADRHRRSRRPHSDLLRDGRPVPGNARGGEGLDEPQQCRDHVRPLPDHRAPSSSATGSAGSPASWRRSARRRSAPAAAYPGAVLPRRRPAPAPSCPGGGLPRRRPAPAAACPAAVSQATVSQAARTGR